MGPARLELFRFSFYVFFPIAIMLHYGDPDWYETYVKPFKESYTLSQIPQIEPPRDKSELREQLEKLRSERLAKRNAATNSSSALAASTAVSSSSPSPTSTSTLLVQSQRELLSDVSRDDAFLSKSRYANTRISSWGDKREV